VSAVERSPARLGHAYALADLGAELVGQRRRRAGSDALRLALELTQKGGATGADRTRYGATWAPAAAAEPGSS
jgi:hypothetical protein